MLEFITGRSGSGKTEYIYKKIKETACRNISEGRHKRVFLVVPEQYTFRAQKDLADRLEDAGAGMLFTEVQSFMRLSYRVFKETGHSCGNCMGELGKVMLVRAVLESNKDKLYVFGKNSGKKGYVSEIKSVLSEMMQYGHKPSDVKKMKDAVSGDRSLAARLSDIELIYREFKKYISESDTVTGDEIMDIFAEAIPESCLLRNADVYFDGFTGFTPLQFKVIKALMVTCDNVYISAASEYPAGRETTDRLFSMSSKTIRRVRNESEKTGILVKEKHFDKNFRCRGKKDLEFLERRIFRPSSKEEFTGIPENINISVLKDPYGEIDFCTEQIRNIMIREKLAGHPVRYSDFAVVTGDIETYGAIARNRMLRSGINVFVDTKTDITDNMFIDAVDSLMRLIRYNYEYSSVMRFIKNGFIGCILSREMNRNISLLDNFIIASGIRGCTAWSHEWKNISETLGTGDTAGKRKDKETAQNSNKDPFGISSGVNELRQKIYDMTAPLYESLGTGSHSIKEYCRGILGFFTGTVDSEKILSSKCDEFRKKGDRARELEYSQIFDVFMKVIDEADKTLGDVMTDFKGFYDIFLSGINESRIGIIPPSADSVSFGDITRSRAGNVKYLFFVGVNDSVIPKAAPKAGVISDDDRELLGRKGFELAPSLHEDLMNEQFYLYLTMAKPSRELFITYSESGTDSRALRPSYVVNRICRLFPELRVSFPDEQMLPEHILGADGGKSYIIGKIRRKEKYDKEMALDIFDADKLKNLEKASLFTLNRGKINKITAEELYGISEGRFLSVSQIEKYAQCEFMYFLNYGLRLKVRREKRVQPADIGNVIHAALESYASSLGGRPWQDVSDEEKEILKKAAFKAALEKEPDNIREGNGINRYIMRRTAKTFSTTVDLIQEQMARGGYTTFSAEMEYTAKLGRESFRGYIDRIDTAEDGENIYVKVTDYKTGNHKFDLSQLYYGIQMQLVVYIGMAEKELKKKRPEKKIVPAGIYYFNVDDYYIDADDNSSDHLKKARPEGLTCEDLHVLREADRELVHESDKGPASLNPDIDSLAIRAATDNGNSGEVMLRGNAQTETSAHIRDLIDYVPIKIKELDNERENGRIKIDPYSTGKGNSRKTACDYCRFRPVCGFDGRQGEGKYRYTDRLEGHEAMRLISEKVRDQKKDS